MTELLELAAADIDDPDYTECCFDCGKTCAAKNNFERGSEKFGKHLTTIKGSTIQYSVDGSGNILDDPQSGAGKYPLPNNAYCPNKWGWGAHHIIPVATLRDHKVRKYLDSGQGEVSCHVGYDVNGTQNGVWLIAYYGTQGMASVLKNDEWVSNFVKQLLKKSGIEVKSSVYSTLSANAKNDVDPLEFKAYLFETLRTYGRQYHDSHGDYDNFVDSILIKIEANLARLQAECIGGSKCKDNSQKPKAPHALVHRLNNISSRLEGYLVGPPENWRSPVYTSTFSRLCAEDARSS